MLNIASLDVVHCRMKSYIHVELHRLIACKTNCHNIFDPLQNEKKIGYGQNPQSNKLMMIFGKNRSVLTKFAINSLNTIVINRIFS